VAAEPVTRTPFIRNVGTDTGGDTVRLVWNRRDGERVLAVEWGQLDSIAAEAFFQDLRRLPKIESLQKEIDALRKALPVTRHYSDGACYGVGDECWPAQPVVAPMDDEGFAGIPFRFPRHSERCQAARVAVVLRE